ncbi:Hypothetical protein, putative [Bodo saltans]|uniref:Zinc finger protein n=1 Tax=Bodo saltans TaxID=75058 RepID=A0A0S4JS71_BODSA|nr:Hypothetical protein, putative [Bodo saltans]|eukprot:CUG92247.1 Hypothetical protein, putative [Bodo saltans]
MQRTIEASMETQCCYVCNKYFEDKVKLGLHLTPCYNEAVSVRKELWHPHPLDLVDEQRYTEYMKGRHQHREQQIASAEKQGISFVTADTFEAMRGTLGPTRHQQNRPSTRERVAHVVPPSPSSPPRPPPQAPQHSAHPQAPPQASPQQYSPQQYSAQQSHQQQVAQPVRVVATGVTMLRNELHSEIEQLKRLRAEEEMQAAARNQQFSQLINNFNVLRGEVPAPGQHAPVVQVPQPAPQQGVPQYYSSPSAQPHYEAQHQQQQFQSPAGVAVRQDVHHTTNAQQRPGSAAPYGTDDSSPFEVMEDGRIRCGTCGKFFGKKGFEVHSQRCYRGAEDFTWSRDARFEKNHPAPNQPVPQLHATRYQGEGGGGGGGGAVANDWTQFMTTYPRPVIDEAPKTAKERNQAADAAKQKAEMNKMIAREMSGAPAPAEEREATTACSKCGRFFYVSRVAKHEANCVAKMKR